MTASYTVSELIDRLKTFDPDLQISLHTQFVTDLDILSMYQGPNKTLNIDIGAIQ